MFRISSKVRLAKIIFCINQIDFYGSVIRVPSVISYNVDIFQILYLFEYVCDLLYVYVLNTHLNALFIIKYNCNMFDIDFEYIFN